MTDNERYDYMKAYSDWQKYYGQFYNANNKTNGTMVDAVPDEYSQTYNGWSQSMIPPLRPYPGYGPAPLPGPPMPPMQTPTQNDFPPGVQPMPTPGTDGQPFGPIPPGPPSPPGPPPLMMWPPGAMPLHAPWFWWL